MTGVDKYLQAHKHRIYTYTQSASPVPRPLAPALLTLKNWPPLRTILPAPAPPCEALSATALPALPCKLSSLLSTCALHPSLTLGPSLPAMGAAATPAQFLPLSLPAMRAMRAAAPIAPPPLTRSPCPAVLQARSCPRGLPPPPRSPRPRLFPRCAQLPPNAANRCDAAASPASRAGPAGGVCDLL